MSLVADRGREPGSALNMDAGLIKLIAMVTMFIDHAGAIFFPNIPEMRLIGRIAFPLYCFGVVMGAAHTHSWPRYALRLALGALIAQAPYMLALHHTIGEWNVMFTLLLGLLSLVGMREKRFLSQIWAPLLCLLAAAVQPMDYGWRGVLLIQLMYLARESRGGMAALMTAFCLYWGASSGQVSSLFGLSLRGITAGGAGNLMMNFLRVQALAILSLPIMLIKTKSGIRIPKWLGYAFYPAHLLILGLIALL
ncbi:MAG: TraX family protein [Christensenellales bacterium]